MRSFRIINADVLDGLRQLPDESVHACVTSPPYWGLRDYGTAKWEGGDPVCAHGIQRSSTKSTLGLGKGLASHESAMRREAACVVPYRDACGKCGAVRVDSQIGLEASPEAYVARLVEVFREVRRVLRDDGTMWMNLGDSYTTGASTSERKSDPKAVSDLSRGLRRIGTPKGLKPKDLVGIPWRVAFALQADGWYLRSDVIWAKPNPMPESVTDRPTKAHEYLFLLAKNERYYFDADAIAEAATCDRMRGPALHPDPASTNGNDGLCRRPLSDTRNRRTVWFIATEPCPMAHFAVMPTALVEPCILAGSPEGGTVLDPFNGSGTVGVVALRHNREYIGVELNPEYVQMAYRRIEADAPLVNISPVVIEQDHSDLPLFGGAA